MTEESINPEVFPENNRGDYSAVQQVAYARDICDARGVRLTHIRQQVLALLWENKHPSGAYELIEALELQGARPIAPPTVYRALDFLIEQGFACKIESRNAFVPCASPERFNEHIFLICDDCEAWLELEDPQLEQQLADEATHAGFKPSRRVVEVLGTCAKCLLTQEV